MCINVYYHAGQDHLNLGESNNVLLCKYFGFSFPQVTWPNLVVLSQVTRK